MRDDPRRARAVVSNSLVVTCVFATFAALALVALGPFLPWGHWLKIEGSAFHLTGLVLGTLLVAVVSIPLSLGQQVLLVAQEGALANLLGAAVYLGGMGVLWGAARARAPLEVLGPLVVLPMCVTGLVQWLFARRRAGVLHPALQDVSLPSLRRTVAAGAFYLLIDLTTALLLRTPEVILARTRGLTEVARFSAVNRFPLLMLAVFMMTLQPMLPALAEARTSSDRPWIVATVRKSLLYTVGLWLVMSAAVLVLGPTFLQLWLGTAAFSDRRLIVLSLLLGLAQGLHSWVMVTLVGLAGARSLFVMGCAMVASYLPLSAMAARGFGAEGVMVALAAAFGIGGFGVGCIFLMRRLRELAAEAGKDQKMGSLSE
jgi:O-antigen/teichoic acid export membrane protein